MNLIYPDITANIGTIVVDSIERKLAALAPHPQVLAAARKYAATFPTLQRTSWVECDYTFYNAPILNQGQFGSCTGHAGATTLTRAMLMQGFTAPPLLSPTFTYAQVNGGRDQGASVSSILQVLSQLGTCTMDECGESTIYTQDIPQAAYTTALLYKAGLSYSCRSFDELGSALTLGMIPAFGISVGQNFSNLSSEGVCPPPTMVIGGHALSACGLKKSQSGAWLIKFQNSWGASWGLNGYAYLSEASFAKTLDAYVIILAKESPADTDQPAAVVADNSQAAVSIVVPELPDLQPAVEEQSPVVVESAPAEVPDEPHHEELIEEPEKEIESE
jgi:hypothetical protein